MSDIKEIPKGKCKYEKWGEPMALSLKELIYLAGINSSPTISTELYNISRADGSK
jgi:hypothetical protein